jgi:hypothetical protein
LHPFGEEEVRIEKNRVSTEIVIGPENRKQETETEQRQREKEENW